MQTEQLLGFGPYRLDLGREQVWKGKHAVKLPPKALVLLRALVTRAGQVVTKEELLEVGWPQTVVSDDALTSCMQELRRALGDAARQPRYIETVHRRGFRFIAPVAASAAPVSSSKFQVQESPKSEVRGPEPEAEECFVKAIEIARQQQAKSLELRAVMSLSRLWQQQGKKKQAHKMLAGIYNWFTEGFDTKDLQEAEALLKELS